jgi:tetratricopeptide (TPR) repeat protein
VSQANIQLFKAFLLMKYAPDENYRLDTSDWRMLAYMGDHLYTHHGSNHEKLSHYWEQAFHFTPSYTLKGRLHRAKLYLNLFGLNDKLCEEYFLLHRQHPTSCHVLNNIAICYVKEKDYQKAREYFVQATEAKGYEHFYKIPKRNLEKFDQWDRSQGFEGSLMY